MDRARWGAFGVGSWLTAAAPLSLLLTGCPALLGIDNDYAARSAGALAGADAASTRAGRATGDATKDAVLTRSDSASHADATSDTGLPPRDSGGALMDASSHDSCTIGCGCPQGQTMCGATCVDLASNLGNCGTCGASCTTSSPSTATCTAARCIVTLASSGGYGSGIAVDATSVYWANQGSVLKVPLGGGSTTTLVASAGQCFQIAVNASNLYWTSSTGSMRTRAT